MKNCVSSFFVIISFTILSFNPSNGQAQNKVLIFNGVSDYVDLDTSVGNNLRTFEMWFKPNRNITSQNLSNFQSLIYRNTGFATANPYEFGIVFHHINPYRGTLRFVLTDSAGVIYNVFSDTTNWNANQWYHVAAVTDSIRGMMLFIDGKKQSDTNAYNGNTGVASTFTALGRWGNFNSRHFNGAIDNVKLSSSAIYHSNFIPECPNPPNKIFDRATYLFEALSSNVAIDSSQQQFHAVIFGATRGRDSICNKLIVGIDALDYSETNHLSVYPNPSNAVFNFELSSIGNSNLNQLIIYDNLGKIVFSKEIRSNQLKVDLSHLADGVYIYRNINEIKHNSSGKLLKF